MNTIAIAYHSNYGHTEKLAQYVKEGCESISNTKVILVNVLQIHNHWANLNDANAIIFGAPTYMGSISAEFKKFMELSSSIWGEQKWNGKFSAGFTSSGSANGDKLNSLFDLTIFAAQHGMNWINLGIKPNGLFSDTNSVENLNRHGTWLGATSTSTPDGILVCPADGATAFKLGQRVADATAKYSK